MALLRTGVTKLVLMLQVIFRGSAVYINEFFLWWAIQLSDQKSLDLIGSLCNLLHSEKIRFANKRHLLQQDILILKR